MVRSFSYQFLYHTVMQCPCRKQSAFSISCKIQWPQTGGGGQERKPHRHSCPCLRMSLRSLFWFMARYFLAAFVESQSTRLCLVMQRAIFVVECSCLHLGVLKMSTHSFCKIIPFSFY